MSSMSDIAKKIAESRAEVYYYPGDNELFEYLYNAYCKLDSYDHNFDLVRIEAREEAAKYCARKGLERCFDKAEDKIKGVNAKTCQKFYTRTCLKTYDRTCKKVYKKAYLKLVHWYQDKYPASYVVLQDATKWTPEERRERNPFREVRVAYEAARLLLIQTRVVELHGPSEDGRDECSQEVKEVYEDARQLLLQSKVAKPRELLEKEQAAFQSNSTRVVQQYILGQKLSRDSFLSYVGSHAEFYNLRHRRLLAEHERLVNLFSELYVRGTWDGDEPKCSLRKFLTTFCKKFEDRRFKEHIHWWVAKRGRHPTREFMIVLWMYSYSFLFCPEVIALSDFRKIIPFERMDKSLELPEEYPFADYYVNGTKKLSVLEYLSDAMYDTRTKSSPLDMGFDSWGGHITFSGTELIAFINERLRSYSWRPLDSKNAFDCTVISLDPLQITIDRDKKFEIKNAFYGNEPIDNAWALNIDNVPGPLAVVFRLLQEIADLTMTRPLPCDMYELI